MPQNSASGLRPSILPQRARRQNEQLSLMRQGVFLHGTTPLPQWWSLRRLLHLCRRAARRDGWHSYQIFAPLGDDRFNTPPPQNTTIDRLLGYGIRRTAPMKGRARRGVSSHGKLGVELWISPSWANHFSLPVVLVPLVPQRCISTSGWTVC